MPDTPPVENLGDGIWSLPVPIPDNPLGSTLVYLVAGSSGPVLVDTGWNHDDAWDALARGIEHTGHSVGDVRGAVVTHFHPDHLGLADRLREASGAWIAMHPADTAAVEALAARNPAGRREDIALQLRRAGFPEEEVGLLSADPLLPVPSTAADITLADGDRVDLPGRDLRAVWTPGHTPGHLCLHLGDSGHLFTGDHVLPRITPHVGQFPLTSPEGDPLGDFLASQKGIADLPGADALVCLPSHETRFSGLAERAREITDHHEKRLEELLALLAERPLTLWEASSLLTWRRPWDAMRPRSRHMAASETAAHLRLLEERGRIRRTGPETLPRWGAVRIAKGHE